MSRMGEFERAFEEVVDLPEEERRRWLEENYADDLELHEFVESLVDCDQEQSDELHLGATSHESPLPDIEGWELLQPIGEGGMGRVYLASDLGPLGRRAAIKVLKRGLDTDETLRRFESERRTLARMQHPGIATVFEAGATRAGQPYVAMEFVDGAPITEHCRGHSLSLDERLELFVRVCEAVQHAHHKGIVHRDLKPSNILLVDGEDGPRVKVIDFGIAKAIDSESSPDRTRRGQVLGTLNYMSPEQIEGGEVDVRTDVYALGLLLYHLITDRSPYEAAEPRSNSLEEWRSIIVDGPTPRPSSTLAEGRASGSVSRAALGSGRDLDWIVLKALDKDPARRYVSAMALADDVLRYRRREPIVARPPTLRYRVTRFVDRYRGVVIATLLIFISLIAGLFGSLWGFLEAREQADRARHQAERELIAREEASLVANFLSDLINVPLGTPNGEETTIREAVDAVAAKIDRNYADKPRVAALIHLAIGRAYSGLQRVEDARSHLQKSVVLNEPWISSSVDRLVLHRGACRSLAMLERVGSNLDLAKEWIRKGLAPAVLDDPRDSAVRIGLRFEQAQVYLQEGRLAECENLLRELVAEKERYIGIDEEFLHTRGLLAMIAREKGDMEEATELLGEVLADAIRIYGEEHARTCRAYFNHAAALRNLGRMEEAEAGYLRAVDLARNIWGDTSSDLGLALQGLAHLKRSRGQRREALRRYVEALEVLRRVYGPEAAASSSLRNSLASLRIRLGDLDAAEELLETNRRILRESGALRTRHGELTQQWTAELRVAQSRPAEAETILDEWFHAVPEVRRHGGQYTQFAVLRAELARRDGRLEQARERLAQVAVTLGVPEAAEDPLVATMRSVSWRCCRARVEHDTGNLELAHELARANWDRAADVPLSLRVRALLCLVEVSPADDARSIAGLLDGLIAEVKEQSGEDDPWIAELQAARP